MSKNESGMSRRDVLGAMASSASLGLAGNAFITRVTSAQPAGAARDARVAGAVAEDDIAAPVIASANGRLKTTLSVVRARNKIGGEEVELRSYNGGLVGPTLRVKAGDVLEIRLENELPWTTDASNSAAHAGTHGAHGSLTGAAIYNATNLHTHGLHVSPQRPADDVLIAILPKAAPATLAGGDTYVGSFDYRYEIPADHLPGTHWYHAHLHGATSIQLASGMAGALIVEGDIDAVPEIKAARERVLLFQQIPFARRDGAPGLVEDEMLDDLINRFNGQADADARQRFTTVNGTIPVLRLKKGQVERWRLIHGGIFETLPIDLVGCSGAFSSGAATLTAFCAAAETATPSDGLAFYPIARDGITLGTLDELRGTPLPMLGPGNRMDVLVKALREGTYVLRKRRDDSLLVALNSPVRFPGAGEVATPAESAAHLGRDAPYALAIIVVEAGSQEMALPSPAAMRALRRPRPLDPASAPEVSHEIRFRRRGDKGYVGERTFEAGQFPRTLVEGRVERWVVRAQREPHPFHIHVNPFLVVEADGAPLAEPLWLDSVFLGNGQSATMLMRYDTYVGRFVLHCHNLVHEDIGMMELVEIVPRPEGTLASIRYLQPTTAPAGDLELFGADGNRIPRQAFAGRLTIVHVWSMDCATCGGELRDLAALKRSLAGRPLEIAAVAAGADRTAAARYLSEQGIDGLTPYGDPERRLPTQLGLAEMPASALVDRDAHVRALLPARIDWQKPEVMRLARYFLG